MAVNIWEYAYGTKLQTKVKVNEIMKMAPDKWRTLALKFLKRVYQEAVQQCPVDTGALRASHRIVQGSDPYSGRALNMDMYMKSYGMKDVDTTYWLVAGGGGYINPKKNTEIDYAQAVHDKNPWLRRSFKASEPYLEKLISDYSKLIGKKWEEDQPITGGYWKVPMRLVGQYSNIVFT